MRILNKIFFLLVTLLFITNCNEKVSYSGKIINNNTFDYSNLVNKNEVISKFGNPNYIDPIENKYFYFFEKKVSKNFFDKKIEIRETIVFVFNANDLIVSVEKYNLEDENDISFAKDKTPNELIERGWIEKIFGGVGKSVITEETQY